MDKLMQDLVKKNVLIHKGNYMRLFDKVDITMWGAKAWAMSLKEISEKKNVEYLYKLGFEFGKDSAMELKEATSKLRTFISKEFQLVENIIEMAGLGIIKINEYKPKKGITINVEYNHIIDYGIKLFKKKSPICHFYRGIYDAFIRVFLDMQNCTFIEKECKKDGYLNCIFEYKNGKSAK